MASVPVSGPRFEGAGFQFFGPPWIFGDVTSIFSICSGIWYFDPEGAVRLLLEASRRFCESNSCAIQVRMIHNSGPRIPLVQVASIPKKHFLMQQDHYLCKFLHNIAPNTNTLGITRKHFCEMHLEWQRIPFFSKTRGVYPKWFTGAPGVLSLVLEQWQMERVWTLTPDPFQKHFQTTNAKKGTRGTENWSDIAPNLPPPRRFPILANCLKSFPIRDKYPRSRCINWYCWWLILRKRANAVTDVLSVVTAQIVSKMIPVSLHAKVAEKKAATAPTKNWFAFQEHFVHTQGTLHRSRKKGKRKTSLDTRMCWSRKHRDGNCLWDRRSRLLTRRSWKINPENYGPERAALSDSVCTA